MRERRERQERRERGERSERRERRERRNGKKEVEKEWNTEKNRRTATKIHSTHAGSPVPFLSCDLRFLKNTTW